MRPEHSAYLLKQREGWLLSEARSEWRRKQMQRDTRFCAFLLSAVVLLTLSIGLSFYAVRAMQQEKSCQPTTQR